MNLNVTIIDWGLGDWYIPHQEYGPRAGTITFMAPEQLFYYKFLDYEIDMWSMGVTLASMVSQS